MPMYYTSPHGPLQRQFNTIIQSDIRKTKRLHHAVYLDENVVTVNIHLHGVMDLTTVPHNEYACSEMKNSLLKGTAHIDMPCWMSHLCGL